MTAVDRHPCPRGGHPDKEKKIIHIKALPCRDYDPLEKLQEPEPEPWEDDLSIASFFDLILFLQPEINYDRLVRNYKITGHVSWGRGIIMIACRIRTCQTATNPGATVWPARIQDYVAPIWLSFLFLNITSGVAVRIPYCL